MSKGAKILLAIAATFAVLIVGSGVLLAASVVRAGVLTVKVHEPGPEGTDVNLHIPAALVTIGMDLMPLVLDHDVTAEIRANLGDMRPAVASALQELENVPDAVLVDVRDGAERVRISKEGRTLEIHVVNPEGTFEISLPAHLLGKIAREIA
jgi:hypothetical protein